MVLFVHGRYSEIRMKCEEGVIVLGRTKPLIKTIFRKLKLDLMMQMVQTLSFDLIIILTRKQSLLPEIVRGAP
jgi:hypothetical protein